MQVTVTPKTGLGRVLTQLDEEGKEHPIVFDQVVDLANETNYVPAKLE